jgi:hypothetical protein
MLAGLTDGLGWIKHIVLIIDDWATSRKMAYRRDQGTAMPNSTEDPVAAVEQRRIGALIAFDINVLDEIIDERCIHVASNGSTRTKAVFLKHVATREVSFDLFEIDEHHIRAFGETAVGRDLSRYRSDAGEANPPSRAPSHHLGCGANRQGTDTEAGRHVAVAPWYSMDVQVTSQGGQT